MYTQRALWQLSVPGTNTQLKEEWMDVFVFWSKANIMTRTGVYFFLSWVMGKPSFLHMTVAEESPSTSQGKTASWPTCAVTTELPSFMTGGTGEKSETLYVEIFFKCILNELVMDSLAYRESPQWKTNWCFQRCSWPHSCTGRCPQAWLPVSRGTDPLPASGYDLPAERIEERSVSQRRFFFFLSETFFRFFNAVPEVWTHPCTTLFLEPDRCQPGTPRSDVH